MATAQLTSDNELLKMTADAEYNLAHSYPDGKVTVDVTQLDLYELGLMPKPMKHPLAFNLSGEARQNRVFTHFTAGDMKLNLSARAGVYPLIRQSTHFVDVLMKQVDEKLLDHAALREALPSAIFSFSAGKENPLAYYMAMKNISFHDASMKFGTAPDWGINGKAAIHALKVDTLQLDTVFFTVKQDTTRMNLRAGVINGPKNPQFSFSTILTGEIRDRDAELLAEYKNEKGKTGVLLGVNARPLVGGRGKGDGLAFTPKLTYKGRPLVRCKNDIYYGSLSDPYVIFMQVLTSKEENGVQVADRIHVTLLSTDTTKSPIERMKKQSDKNGLWSALEIGTIWLEKSLLDAKKEEKK